jgi:AcrR family transcriptional regulator
MVESWPPSRRLEHTRSLLLDAAEATFAQKGFMAASVDDIARAAGYTKGAVYGHFATKEDLFLAVNDRYWRSYFDTFTEILSAAAEVGARELDEVAEHWARLTRERGATRAALGHEFSLYLLRNPDARARVADKRAEVVEHLASYITEGVERLGGTLLVPAVTLAHVIIATSEAIEVASQLDDVDLYGPVLRMYMSAIKMPG